MQKAVVGMVSAKPNNVGTADPGELTDELVKEVYARFGLAVYCAQLVEFELVSLLLLLARFEKRELTPGELDDLDRCLSKDTLGVLVKKLKGHVSGAKVEIKDREGKTVETLELTECLQAALEKRNYLTHRFFSVNAKKMVTARGCHELIEELAGVSDGLREADFLATSLSRLIRKRLGIPEELVQSVARAEMDRARGVDVGHS